MRLVFIGDDEFRVEAKGYQDAKFRGAEAFIKKYSLTCSTSKVAYFATPVMIPNPQLSTPLILKLLKGEKLPV